LIKTSRTPSCVISTKKHDVRTAEEPGWARLVNGDLLRAAEDAGFGVMVTADQSLEYQQNLNGRKLAELHHRPDQRRSRIHV